MVDLSYEIINQIKEAGDDSHVEIIIENSLQNLYLKKITGFGAKRRFMMNLIMALRYVEAEGLTSKASGNVRIAINVLEQQRKKEFDNLF